MVDNFGILVIWNFKCFSRQLLKQSETENNTMCGTRSEIILNYVFSEIVKDINLIFAKTLKMLFHSHSGF